MTDYMKWFFTIVGAGLVLYVLIRLFESTPERAENRERQREIGIRLALGARPRDVLGLILSHGARLAGAGLLVGLIGAVAVTRLLGTLLVGVEAFCCGGHGTCGACSCTPQQRIGSSSRVWGDQGAIV